MIAPAARILAAALLCLDAVRGAEAHALAQRYDLPLPLGFFLIGAGAAVAVSFVLLALFRRRDNDRLDGIGRPWLQGAIPRPIVGGCNAIGVALLLLILCAGLFGNQSTFKNIVPVAVWVVWWVGLSFVCAFLGNVWILINPWTALFEVAERLASPWRKNLSLRLPYPRWMGAWPACVLFFLLAWFELVAPARDVPRNIAVTLAIYSVLTWAGFACFGRELWCRNVEVFSVIFSLFGRFAPVQFETDGRYRWGLRPPAVGLLTRTPLDVSMTAFTLLVLGTVTVDGLMETPAWAAVVERLIGGQPSAGSAASYMMLQTALLAAGPLMLGVLYLTAVALMGQPPVKQLAGQFVLSLVPIAIAYHLAHYFSMLAIAGQFIIPLVSDPLGHGWDLFGTTLYRIDIGLVDARFIWYLSVASIVSGHMIAVWIGHVTAYAVLDTGAARRSQYAMLVLMVGYTMLSLWILAQPIVEPAAK
ncbi:MAG: hypothetical protein K2Y27_04330 [Xanthobacteraceae bacterium]|nr:hypothetical protein [Xanthobacteraceae bacterium]